MVESSSGSDGDGDQQQDETTSQEQLEPARSGNRKSSSSSSSSSSEEKAAPSSPPPPPKTNPHQSPPRTPTRQLGRNTYTGGKSDDSEERKSGGNSKHGGDKHGDGEQGGSKHGDGKQGGSKHGGVSNSDSDSDEDKGKGKEGVDNDKDVDSDDDDDDDDDEEEDEEPLLKYTKLTKNQGGLYRNGDTVSTFVVAGDKMIAGTHDGKIHVISLPSFTILKSHRVHQASVTAISVSPFPPPLPTGKSKPGGHGQDAHHHGSSNPSSPKAKPEAAAGGPTGSPSSRAQQAVANTPSNQIYIASSSLDGFVVVQSLVDGRDVIRRGFGRPVHTVSLSPDYKNDRTYLSGGTAALLVKTVGGTIGKTSTSTTVGGASATAQGWLGSVGLGSDEGKDTVLHSGEGKINAIKWSLSGKYVVWVNEQGIKLMRSHLHHESSSDPDLAWKRMSHLDRPSRQGWDEMAAVWKARVEWVDEDGLERDSEVGPAAFESKDGSEEQPQEKKKETNTTVQKNRVERLLIGWGGSIWIMDVHPGEKDPRASTAARLGKLEVVTILRTDCIISGLSLYTPSLLLCLAYIQPDEKDDRPVPQRSPGTPSGGRRRRQNAVRPEMRIIDIRTKEEISIADTLDFSRFDSLTAADYHLGTLPVIRESTKVTSSKGALEMMGSLGSNIYGGIWDVAMYPKHLLNSGASIMSYDIDTEKPSSKHDAALLQKKALEPSANPALLTRGIKVFLQSPYDCILATKPTIVDHLHWLEAHEEYEAAWNLLDENPDAATALAQEGGSSSPPATPTKASASLQDFWTDDASLSAAQAGPGFHSPAAKEKRNIGDKWIGKLAAAGEWQKAGQVAGKVLDTVKYWDIWFWRFVKEQKIEEIIPFIPADRLPHQALLPATIYEHSLGHYIASDPPQFRELLANWSTDLFDPSVIIKALEGRLEAGDIRENSVEDGQRGSHWRILNNGLAKLYFAAGRYRDSLKAYVRLQDAEAALALIKSQHLAYAVADDIPSLIRLRVSKDQILKASVEELDEASRDIIQLLIVEAYQGIIPTTTVISQLKSNGDFRPFLFFYLRDLWIGLDTTTSLPLATIPDEGDPTANVLSGPTGSSPQATRFAVTAARSAARELDESRALVNDAADVALPLFAAYQRPLFASFLRISNSYTLSTASGICEEYDYVPELVFLLAKEGRARRALHLILDRLGDISQAMAFAREQGDSDLWDDLVEYSLSKPEFIKILLEEAGSAGGSSAGLEGSSLDPIGLVKRIPDGMEIDGLKEALGRMLRESELRASISEGVLRVCRGEVTHSMTELRSGQKRGIKFQVWTGEEGANAGSEQADGVAKAQDSKLQSPSGPDHRRGKRRRRRRRLPESVPLGRCAACGEMLLDGEPGTLISFPCSHVFHLSCLILYESMPVAPEEGEAKEDGDGGGETRAESATKDTANARDRKEDDDNEDEDEDESDPEAGLGLPEPEQEETVGGGGGGGGGGPLGRSAEAIIPRVGAKVRYAKVIRGRVAGGCPLVVHTAA